MAQRLAMAAVVKSDSGLKSGSEADAEAEMAVVREAERYSMRHLIPSTCLAGWKG